MFLLLVELELFSTGTQKKGRTHGFANPLILGFPHYFRDELKLSGFAGQPQPLFPMPITVDFTWKTRLSGVNAETVVLSLPPFITPTEHA